MLRYGLVVAAVLGAAGPALSATWADALFDEFSKDFGSVPRGPMLSHPFRVVNNTRHPVTISDVRVSCGCVSAVALKNHLKPGESTFIVARMDTTRFTGLRSVTIYVQFSEPAFEEVRLWVQANGRNDFALTPDTLAFGQLKRGGSPSASVLLSFYGNTETQITEAKCESNYIQPRVQEVRRSDDGRDRIGPKRQSRDGGDGSGAKAKRQRAPRHRSRRQTIQDQASFRDERSPYRPRGQPASQARPRADDQAQGRRTR